LIANAIQDVELKAKVHWWLSSNEVRAGPNAQNEIRSHTIIFNENYLNLPLNFILPRLIFLFASDRILSSISQLIAEIDSLSEEPIFINTPFFHTKTNLIQWGIWGLAAAFISVVLGLQVLSSLIYQGLNKVLHERLEILLLLALL